MNETIKATLRADGTQFNSELKKAQSRTSSFEKTIMSAGKSIAGFLGARSIISGINTLRNEIDELGKTATRLRLPVGDVQALTLAAKTGGTDIGTLVSALERAQVAATEAGRGTQRYADEFAALGINIAEFQRLDHEGRLRLLADAYANATDKGEAFTSLTRIMGRSVGKLLPLLEKGGDAIDAMGKSVTRLSDADVRAIEKMNDQIAAMAATIQTTLMAAIMAIRPQLEWLTATLKDGSAGIRDMLDAADGRGLKGDLMDVIETLRQIDQMGGETAGHTNKKFQALIDRFGAMNEELKIQARQILDSAMVAERLKSGEINEQDAEAQINEINRLADAARDLLDIELARAEPAQDLTEYYNEQAAAAEKLAEAEAKASAKLAERIQDMAPLADQLANIKKEAKEIFTAQGTPGGNFQFLQDKLEKTTDPAERLALTQAMERLLDLREKAAKIAQEISREEKSAADAAARAAEEKLAAEQKALDLAKEQARIQQEMDRARGDFAAETEALKLELAGRKDLADALREETRIREESIRLAERLGVTEEQALDLLRQQARLRRAIAAQENTPEARGARRERDRFGSGSLRTGSLRDPATRLDGSPSTLRNATLDRRAADRAARPRDTAADAAKYWEQQLGLQERLVKQFERLGAI